MSLDAQILLFSFNYHAENSGPADAVVDSNHGKKKGMVLPFEPHSITFDEIVYSVDMPQVSQIH